MTGVNYLTSQECCNTETRWSSSSLKHRRQHDLLLPLLSITFQNIMDKPSIIYFMHKTLISLKEAESPVSESVRNFMEM